MFPNIYNKSKSSAYQIDAVFHLPLPGEYTHRVDRSLTMRTWFTHNIHMSQRMTALPQEECPTLHWYDGPSHMQRKLQQNYTLQREAG